MKELDKRGGKLDLGEELDVGPPGTLPPQEECPICMLVLPIHNGLQAYASCCGKTICGSCDYRHQVKSEEQAAERGQTQVARTCVFCRTAVPNTDEKVLACLRKRIERKDPHAMRNMAMFHGEGGLGMPVDQAKCIELLRQSAGLGFPPAQYALGTFYDTGEMGLEQNKEEAVKSYQKAAEGGNIHARNNLGCTAAANGDYVAAMRHWRLAASGGYKPSMGALIVCFGGGFLHHGDLAETLQAMYRARAEMKSEGRDQYIKHLKETGEYREENHEYF